MLSHSIWLDDVAARLTRAEEHFNSLKREIRRWHDTRPYRIVKKTNSDSTRYSVILRMKTRPPLERFSILVSDCVQNLRAALDYLVYAVAVQESGENPPPDFKKLQFPITDSPALFEKSKWRIESLSPKIQDVIESLQPYKRPHPTVPPLLAILRDFNDSDKHRLLHVLINATPQGQFRNIGHVPEGVNISVEIYQPSSGIEDKAEIAAIIFSEPTPDVNYQFMADFVIAMSHAPNPGTGVPWSDIGSIVIRLTITEHLS